MSNVVGRLEIQMFAGLARLQKDMNKVNRVVDRSMKKVDKSVALATKAFGLLGGALVLKKIGDMSDQYTKYNAILRIATDSQVEFNKANRAIFAIAKRSQAELSSIGTVYSRISLALKDFGATGKEVANITEALALSLKVNGATSEETTSTMIQLSQAFGKGKLDGDEFRTAMEAAPNVMRELAKSMGVPFGALKDLAKQGEITSEVLLKTFNNPDLIRRLRQQAIETKTINGAWQTFTNSLTVAIGKIDDATGASRILIGVLEQAAVLMSVFKGGEDGSRLRNFLDTGQKAIDDRAAKMSTGELKKAAQWYGWAREALKARQALQENIKLNSALDGNTGAPSFGSEIAAQDIRKIHAAQEAARRSNRRHYETRVRLAKQAADEEAHALKEQERKRIDFEGRIWDANKAMNDRKIKALQEIVDAEFKAEERVNKRKQQSINDNLQKQKKAADEHRRYLSRISDSLTDALLRGFESGKGFAENFIDTLKNMFKTLVLRPAVNFVLNSSGISKFLAGIGGAFSGQAQAGTGSITGLLGSIKDSFGTLNTDIVGSIKSLGSFLSTGNGGLGDVLGGALGQYSSQIAGALPYAGAAFSLLSGDIKGAAFQGVGTAIGSAFGGPVGGAIGSIVGKLAGGLFGGGDLPDRVGSAVSTSLRGDSLTTRRVKWSNTDNNSAIQGTLTQATTAVAQGLNAIHQAFGTGNGNINVSARYKGRDGGSAYKRFTASVDGLGRTDTGYYRAKDAFGDADFKKFLDRITNEFLSATITKLDLPTGIKSFFRGLKSGVAETIQALVSMSDAVRDMPPLFDSVREVLDTNKFKLGLGDLTAQFQATQQFYSLFYTEAEQFETFTAQITRSFNELNKTLPSTREEYRAMVDAFQIVDKATSDQKTALLGLAPAMVKYFDYLEQGTTAVNQALSDGLNRDLFTSYADYISAQSNALEGGDISGFLAKVGSPEAMNEALIAEVKMLREQVAEGEENNKAVLEAIAKYTSKTADIQKQWNDEGQPEERVL